MQRRERFLASQRVRQTGVGLAPATLLLHEGDSGMRALSSPRRLARLAWLVTMALAAGLACGSEGGGPASGNDAESSEEDPDREGAGEPGATETNFQIVPCVDGQCPEAHDCVDGRQVEGVPDPGPDAGEFLICVPALP